MADIQLIQCPCPGDGARALKEDMMDMWPIKDVLQ